ncbi:WD-40 repeat protein [Reticulomyxa filosa]|uniref:WD-40 repeat protein n=1 Tax=Reticulomyxa filosa TaxID=46433 RepID=X6N816_RETFI|nr:WD-40 repeat protein [Reticulomyxa filosa]|eukprot:ETO22410.1 WD-40 repeat protein [Reticulomyxa filosa]
MGYEVYCVKFSSYYYHNHRQNVICSSSEDKTIRFWDFKNNKQLQICNGHTNYVSEIEFSPFNGGRYLCSGSGDKTIRLWDVETSKSLHVFNGHENTVYCVDISPLQINNNNDNNNKMNNIGVIGGNGYTICSGSWDKTIRIWDIETTKQLNAFKGHTNIVRSVKYGSNELLNTILSGSLDESVRLWDIRSGKQIQVFNGHTDYVVAVEYSPFVIKNSINQLYVIEGNDEEDGVIFCLKFIRLKKKDKTKNITYGLNMDSLFFVEQEMKKSKLILNLFDLIEYKLKNVFILCLMFFKELKSIINENCALYFVTL